MAEDNDFLNQFKKDWNDFKDTNEKILKNKAEGKSVSELEEKLQKLEKSISEKQAKADEHLAKVETALKRTTFGQDSKGNQLTQEQAEHKAGFLKFFRKGHEDGLADLEKKALQVSDDTQGGYMVHADLSGRIIERIFETSPIRRFASIATISTDALEGPVDANQADYGWVGETGVRPQTANPKIGMWRIPTHEIYAMPAATQKLLDDAAWDPESWLASKVADRFSRAENNAFVLGDGVGKPRGFLATDKIIEAAGYDNYINDKKVGYVKTGVNDGFPTPPAAATDPGVADPLINCMQSLKTQYREMSGTAWAMHRTTIGAVRRLRDNFGRYIWEPGFGSTPQSLFGYPVAEFNDMPQLGDANKYAIAFGNWKTAYQIVDRIGIRVLRDPYTSKPFVLFYTTKRTGGDLLNYEALKLVSFSA